MEWRRRRSRQRAISEVRDSLAYLTSTMSQSPRASQADRGRCLHIRRSEAERPDCLVGVPHGRFAWRKRSDVDQEPDRIGRDDDKEEPCRIQCLKRPEASQRTFWRSFGGRGVKGQGSRRAVGES